MISNKPIRVLVVDDEAIINELVQTQLIDLGYEVVSDAYDGPEAAKLTCQLQPDIVLMDLQMPIMNGFEATIEIRKKDKTTPIIALTANVLKEDKEKIKWKEDKIT